MESLILNFYCIIRTQRKQINHTPIAKEIKFRQYQRKTKDAIKQQANCVIRTEWITDCYRQIIVCFDFYLALALPSASPYLKMSFGSRMLLTVIQRKWLWYPQPYSGRLVHILSIEQNGTSQNLKNKNNNYWCWVYRYF